MIIDDKDRIVLYDLEEGPLEDNIDSPRFKLCVPREMLRHMAMCQYKPELCLMAVQHNYVRHLRHHRVIMDLGSKLPPPAHSSGQPRHEAYLICDFY